MEESLMWKTIEGYQNYEINELAEVRNKKSGRILKSPVDGHGYRRVTLHNVDGQKTKKIHRLVAEYFIPNPDNLPQLNHIDGNKQNNDLNNLEWCSMTHNLEHAYKMNLNRSIPVRKYTLDGEFIAEFKSITEAYMSMYGINKGSTHISAACTGKQKTAYGFIWKYAEINPN
jgi:hypothetical protein